VERCAEKEEGSAHVPGGGEGGITSMKTAEEPGMVSCRNILGNPN
jgi:hypothetical protein